MTPDIDQVSGLLLEAARELVLPRFGKLRSHEIEAKPSPLDPADIVTVVDREVESYLGPRLDDLTPGAVLVAEEACHRNPSLLDAVHGGGGLWLLDPIDGTKNFARGREAFGIMLGWVEDGRTRAAWILLPASGELFAAEAGGGAFLNGERVRVAEEEATEGLRGSLHRKYMPPDLVDRVLPRIRDRYERVPLRGCAAVEYTGVVGGSSDFTVYHRLHPWDHAPGALVLTEAGGRVEHIDGTPYTPRSADQPTFVARSPEVARRVRGWWSTA
jgi:fructose-1,6-bisphosphatase/inositol monophosphatase family enzyme